MNKVEGWKAWTLIGSLTVIALLINVRFGDRQREGEHRSTTQSDEHPHPLNQQDSPNGRLIDLTTNWSEPILQMGKRIEAHPISRDVWWQMRADKDENKVYDLPPVNAPTKQAFEIEGGSFCMQYRIRPGQTITKGALIYQLMEAKQVTNAIILH
jgi:hypothetical protein